MSQRPTIKKPTPLSEPAFRKGADPVMGGVNIPSFSAEMQAEVSPEAAPLWNFVLSHARVIAAGVVAIVLIILAVAGWQLYREEQIKDARMALGRIISIQDSTRRVAALEGFLKDAPSALVSAAQLELAASAVAVEDWDKAAAAYEAVAANEDDTPLAYAARLNHAQVLMHKGDFAAARDEFKTLAASAPAECAGETINAPLVGTFYAASAPGEAPFVQAGSQVKQGDTVCLLEAMKMISEVPAPFDCVIEEVLAKDGELAAFDSPLFRVRRL